MAHYAAQFSIHRLALDAHLGVYDAERASPQPVAISLRLYFSKAPICAGDDHGAFIDYAALCDAITHAVETREFRLIEFMAQECFGIARAFVDKRGATDVALWLKLTKLAPDVKHLQQGASFTLSDLPADATVVPE